ncbi:hypothetical protein [Halanaerobacter jeridensis]|uniref:Uncharacterized protein n=1 Tax=Halanaerobacter jeridensis TaxID=706427 RepID=A0A938XS79_9FIRM|nr:hypothetical protein [Halanaerobacter jeridensis]MBM7556503.1 hypothetical protein [Halanaerobacter jeridensis]
MKHDPKNKSQKEDDDELVIDYNPDDMEAGEELPGIDEKKRKNREKNRDYSPDDFE